MDSLVKRAQDIAESAHRGQVDKNGQAYIEHPKRVAGALRGDNEAQAVAWLHDVIEDTIVDDHALRTCGIPPEIVTAIEAITHHNGEHKDDYYARVKANPLALKVKLADIADNTDPIRMAALEPDTRERLTAKYAHALEVLGVAP